MNQNHKVRPSLPHVALVVETSTAFGRAILGGIAQYVREYGPWTIYIEQRSLQDRMPPWMKRWGGDGIIAITDVRMQRVRQLLAQTDLPLAEIAHRTGYAYTEYLSTTFRRESGKSPSAYRRDFKETKIPTRASRP